MNCLARKALWAPTTLGMQGQLIGAGNSCAPYIFKALSVECPWVCLCVRACVVFHYGFLRFPLCVCVCVCLVFVRYCMVYHKHVCAFVPPCVRTGCRSSIAAPTSSIPALIPTTHPSPVLALSLSPLCPSSFPIPALPHPYHSSVPSLSQLCRISITALSHPYPSVPSLSQCPIPITTLSHRYPYSSSTAACHQLYPSLPLSELKGRRGNECFFVFSTHGFIHCSS